MGAKGRLAVEAVQAFPYDLILMDVQMPELDGLDATREIRALEQETGGRIPILALTASVMREDHDKCAAAGIDGIEAKPIDFNTLFAVMERIVPAGCGMFRTTVPIATRADVQIDFSPLDGVVDHAKGLKSWLNPKAYAKALLSFAAERVDDSEKLANLLKDNQDDSEAALGLTHALKGVAGNLSITQIAVLTSEIETALKSGQRQALDILLPNLDHALTQTTQAISRLQPPVTPRTAPSNAFDKQVVCRLLSTLCNALGELNPDAVEPVLAELSKYLSNAELDGILRAVDGFDFDEAVSQSLHLAEKLGLTIE